MIQNTELETIIFTDRTELLTARRALQDLETASNIEPDRLANAFVLAECLRLVDLVVYEDVDSFITAYYGDEAQLIKQSLYRRRAGLATKSWEYAHIANMLGEQPPLEARSWEERFGPKHSNLSFGPAPALPELPTESDPATGKFPVIYP